jgi:hypothetical protein
MPVSMAVELRSARRVGAGQATVESGRTDKNRSDSPPGPLPATAIRRPSGDTLGVLAPAMPSSATATGVVQSAASVGRVDV